MQELLFIVQPAQLDSLVHFGSSGPETVVQTHDDKSKLAISHLHLQEWKMFDHRVSVMAFIRMKELQSEELHLIQIIIHILLLVLHLRIAL